MNHKTTFQDCLKQRKAWYKTLSPLKCSILNEDVSFTSKGFNHLKYKGKKPRSVKEYHQRLWLLPLIIEVIREADSIYDYVPPKYSKTYDKYQEIWELRGNVQDSEVTNGDTFNISVVLRRMGDGNIHFYSVWRNKKIRTAKKRP